MYSGDSRQTLLWIHYTQPSAAMMMINRFINYYPHNESLLQLIWMTVFHSHFTLSKFCLFISFLPPPLHKYISLPFPLQCSVFTLQYVFIRVFCFINSFSSKLFMMGDWFSLMSSKFHVMCFLTFDVWPEHIEKTWLPQWTHHCVFGHFKNHALIVVYNGYFPI